jgi:hypothetical protein
MGSEPIGPRMGESRERGCKDGVLHGERRRMARGGRAGAGAGAGTGGCMRAEMKGLQARRERAGVGGVSARCAGLEASDPGATERKLAAGHGGDLCGRYRAG